MPATTTLKRGVAFHRSNLYSAAENLSISRDGMSWPARRLNKSLLNLSRPYQTLTPGTTQRIAPAVSTKLAILTEEPKTKKHSTYVDFIHKITQNPREIGHLNHKTASTPSPVLYIINILPEIKFNTPLTRAVQLYHEPLTGRSDDLYNGATNWTTRCRRHHGETRRLTL